MKLQLHLLLICTLTSLTITAQVDRTFWFAAPDITEGYNTDFSSDNGKPLNLHITALYATTVKISMPAYPSFEPVEYDLDDMEHLKINLLNLVPLSKIETQSNNDVNSPSTNGFLIESSPGEISAYMEWDNNENKEIMPLKGKNALGNDFWVSTQNQWPRYDFGNGTGTLNIPPNGGFVLLATEDGTKVKVHRNSKFKYFTVPATELIEFTLDRGETFAFTTLDDEPASHLNGVHIEADKNIVVTSFEDALNFDGGCGIDMIVDQMVPTPLVGTEYFAKRGVLDHDEYLIVNATTNGTTFSYNGVSYSLNEGEQKHIKFTTDTAHISSNLPVYVNHLSGIKCELASAFLPSIESCVGSHLSVFTRSFNAIDVLYLSLIARNDPLNLTINNFYIINDGDSTKIPAGYFETTSDGKFVYLKSNTEVYAYISSLIPPSNTVKFYNPVSRFQAGILEGYKNYGAKYGFVSDYNNSPTNAGIGGFSFDREIANCDLSSVRFAASGGQSYVWTGISNPGIVSFLSNDSIADPIFSPDTAGSYTFNVKINGACGNNNIQLTAHSYPTPAAEFSISANEGCSPMKLQIENTSNTQYTAKNLWTFAPNNDTINQDTLSNPFDYTFPDNLSDTLQVYTVKLNAYSPGDYCSNSRLKTYVLKPQVETHFTTSIDSGCAPLLVSFEETALSGHDTLNFRWDFDNGSQSIDTTPSMTFANGGSTTKIYQVELVAETPFGCKDTLMLPIKVYPIAEAAFSVDTNYSCSPLKATFNPSASINADSLFWYIDYSDGDSSYFTDINAPITITHYDTTINSGPDTLSIYLAIKNAQGCVDTSSTPELIVYPNITAAFSIDKDSLCDGDSVLITNLSDGYHPRYEWDFGNSSYAQDSVITNYRKIYFNRSDKDTIYTITLDAISENICSSSKDTAITVHPYLKADFGFEYANNCSPLNTTISNTSIRVDNYEWDLGDGTTSNSNVSFLHTYLNPNLNTDTSYVIKLIATSAEGCKDSLSRSLELLPEVIADFNISENSICSNSNISFTNNSSGSNTYKWSFGDNQSSTDNAVNFTKYFENNFENDTNYTIQLIAYNAVGCADTLTSSVLVYANIKAFFSLPTADSCSPFTIRPKNLSSSSSKTFNWNFGTSGTSTAENPTVSPYINNTSIVSDTAIIELAVSGADDSPHWACSDTHRIPIYIYPELRLDFTPDNAIDCNPLKTGFANNSLPNSTSGTLFEWYLNEAYYSNLETPSELTLLNNTDVDSTHTIWLYGETKYGCRDTASHSLEVYALIEAGFTLDRVGLCDYDSVFVDRTSSKGQISSEEWKFNNIPFPYTKTQFNHSFDSHSNSISETQTVQLKVENNHGCSDSLERTILLYPTVVAGYSADTTSVCFPHTTKFSDTSRNEDHWSWTFGDGLSSSDESPTHTYSNYSKIDDITYDVQLVTWSDFECYDTATGQITIFAKPKANFEFESTIACPPFDVLMRNHSEGSNLSYFWSYDDSTSTAPDTVSFKFNNYTNNIEEQTIQLVVMSDKECYDTVNKIIRVYPNLHANINLDDSIGCSPLNINLSIDDTTNIQQILWYVDEKAFSSIVDPSYRFVNYDNKDNTYTIKVVAHSVNNCIDSSYKTIKVFPTPDIDFSATPIPADYDYVNDQTIINFTNSTKHLTTWEYEWDFGDGTTDQQSESASNFDHIYGDRFWGKPTDNFRVPVTLTTRNPNHPICADSLTQKIIINAPTPQVDIFEDLEGCLPFTVNFSSYTKYVYDSSMYWSFGYGLLNGQGESPTYTYTEPGVYNVTLTVEGDGGVSKDYKHITVYPKPTVDFSFNDTIVAIEIDTVNFYNHSSNNAENYWYFDYKDIETENYNSTEKNPVWVYTTPGLYWPALVAKSAEDCYDTLISKDSIVVYDIGLVNFPNIFSVVPGQPDDEYATPQTDGGNRKVFYPAHVSVDNYHLEVFNRWGSKVFESFDVNRGWNGMTNGKMGIQGIYVYRCRGHFLNGLPYDINGDVTLIYFNGVE